MAAPLELSFKVQEYEARRRASARAEKGLPSKKYLTPWFLSYFPIVMESKEDDICWNEVSGLFRRRDAIPATFIDQLILVDQMKLGVFGESGVEIAERRALALFKLEMNEGDRYGLTVVYIPTYQRRLPIEEAIGIVDSIKGNAVALVGMPKDTKKCAYMPEPSNGEHYTLLPVSGDADTCSGNVGDFAAALLTTGSAHYRIEGRVVVKLPGSFTSDAASKELVNEEVYRRGPLWTNRELIEVNDDDEHTPILIDDRTLAMERYIYVAKVDVYTDTAASSPLTLVACKPGYEPDCDEYVETVPEMQERLDREMDEQRGAQRLNRIRQMQQEEEEAAEMDTTPADPSAIPGTNLHIVTPEGVTMEDFSGTGQAVVDLTASPAQTGSLGNVGGQASQPQEAAGGSKAAGGDRISDEELNSRLLLLKCLDKMNLDQNILEDAYYKCVELVREVVKAVSADLDNMENAYVAAVMTALGKWQESGAKALQSMHTASAKEWDKLHAELIKATVQFRNDCLEAETTEANGIDKVTREIASGMRKDPATDIMERSFRCTRKVVDEAADNFCVALKDTWLGSVSSEQLPTLVASSHGVLMTFRTAIWRLITDESVWPSRLRSAGFCKMAPIVRQSLTSIPALCGLVVPPRPSEPTATPSPVQSFLMGRRSAAASPQATSPKSGGSTPAGTPTGAKKPLLQSVLSPMGPPATTQPLMRHTPTSGASSTLSSAPAGPSHRPGLFSSLPSPKLGTSSSTIPRKAGGTAPTMSSAGLAVSTPGLATLTGGRSSFATNPYITRPPGRSRAAGVPSGDSDKAVTSDISKLAQEASRKRHLEEGDAEEEDEVNEETDDSDIEDMTIPTKKGKGRQSPAKASKKESATENYTEADIAIVRADRYSRDLSDLQSYRNNVASVANTGTVNLASHEDYLDSVIANKGITSHVVFEYEPGKEYLKKRGVSDFSEYDDGWKISFPRTTTGRFPDKSNVAIDRVMMVYRRPNGAVVRDDDKDGFGRTCLMGLWGLHAEGALMRCTHFLAEGHGKISGVNVCPVCRFWNTNDITLNNHVRKHYNMGLCCPEDGFVSASAKKMRTHLDEEHDYKMRSGKDKRTGKQSAKKSAH